MSKTKWYAKPIYLLVALALVLSLGIVAVPMAGTVEANSITWTEYLGNPVFDGINRAYYPRVLAIDGTYHMWYTDTDSAGNYQVGYTTSADGISWETADMVTGLTGTPNHVVVVNVGTEASPHYRIWYANAAVWPYNVDLLRTAESEDGLAWTNDQPIVQANNLIREDNSSDPAYQWVYGSYGPGAVLYNPDGYESLDEEDPMGNKYVMYYDQYTRYGSTGVNEVTMLAISTDGINWKRYGNTPVLNATGGSTAWDAQYAYAWTVLELSDGYHMWYSGGTKDSNDGIGYAYSADGLTWTKEPNPVLHVNDVGAPEWRQERSYTPCVIKEGTTYKMWFAGKGSGYSIGYATGSAPPSEVWVDDDWAGLSPGDPADGHIFGYDAFATIQDGIDAVAGSTVNVAAGTYDSSSGTFPIVIDKSLTLLGAQANVDPRPSEAGRTGDESIIDADETSSAVIQISASDVEINGFTITGGTGDMVEESSSADNLLFRYNILYDDLATCNPGDEAIQIKNSDGVVMEYNYAYNICEDAFNLSDSTNGAIRYNEAHDIYSENAAIYCYGSTGLEIRGNLIYDVPNNDGIKLGDKNGADASKTGGLIKDNIVHDTRQDGVLVHMISDTLPPFFCFANIVPDIPVV